MATLAYSVRQAVKAAGEDQRDQATAALAISYARLIDNAAPAARYAAALRWLAGVPVDDPAEESLREIIVVALSAHTVASDLGPKLLAALEALILSPRARAAAKKAVSDVKPAGSPLDQIAERRARRRAAPGVDPGASQP
jgi:hypothetical protein